MHIPFLLACSTRCVPYFSSRFRSVLVSDVKFLWLPFFVPVGSLALSFKATNHSTSLSHAISVVSVCSRCFSDSLSFKDTNHSASQRTLAVAHAPLARMFRNKTRIIESFASSWLHHTRNWASDKWHRLAVVLAEASWTAPRRLG